MASKKKGSKKDQQEEEDESFDWDKEGLILKLIALVKLHHCLYEIKNKLYKNIIVKKNAWKTIAEEIGCSESLIFTCLVLNN